MGVSIKLLADLVQGELLGDGEIVINAPHTLKEARSGDITFVENEKHLPQLHHSSASAAIVPFGVPLNGKALIQVADPLLAFISVVRFMQGKAADPVHGIDPKADVHPSVKIGNDSSVHAFAAIRTGTTIGARARIHSGAVVGRNCIIGDDVTLFPNVVLYDDTIVGNRVTIHANSVVGADGFGYRFHDGKHVKVAQLGRVELGDDVEIGACSTIDRSTFETTRIGEGTKIDNLVQIAHNCQIGKHNLLVSQTGIAGSSSTGDFVITAGQVGVIDHIHIGSGVVLGAKSGVIKDVPDGERMLGAPATPEGLQKRLWVTWEKLPKLSRDLRKIKQKLGMKDDD